MESAAKKRLHRLGWTPMGQMEGGSTQKFSKLYCDCDVRPSDVVASGHIPIHLIIHSSYPFYSLCSVPLTHLIHPFFFMIALSLFSYHKMNSYSLTFHPIPIAFIIPTHLIRRSYINFHFHSQQHHPFLIPTTFYLNLNQLPYSSDLTFA
jgi:hypothetical protein